MASLSTLVVKLVGDIGPFVTEMGKAVKTAKDTGGGITSALGSGLGKVGDVMKIAAGASIAAIGAIGSAAFAAGMDIDAAYDTIITKTGATGKTLETLKDDFTAVFTTIPTTAEKAGSVIGELNRRLGLTGKPLQDISGNILEMSRLLKGDATTSAQLFGRVMGDWGLSAGEASGKLDVLFVASQKTGVGVDKLMTQVVQFGSPMRLMGFSFEDTAALLGKWEKEGVNAELVMGSLRIAAGKFAKEQSSSNTLISGGVKNMADAQKKLLELQVNLDKATAKQGKLKTDAEKQLNTIKIQEYTSQIGTLHAAMDKGVFVYAKSASSSNTLRDSLLKTFDQIKNNTNATEALALGMKVFGAKAGPDMVAAIREGRFATEDLIKALGGAEGAIAKTASATEDFPEKFTVMKNKIESALAPLGIAIMDAIGGAMEAVGPVLEQALPAIIGAFTSVVAWVQVNWPTIRAVIEPVIQAIISALQTAVAWIQTNWPKISEIISGAFEQARAVLVPIVNTISTVVTSVFSAISTFLNTHGEGIEDFLTTAWETIQSIVSGVANALSQIINGIFGGIATFINTHSEQIKSFLTTAWQTIQRIIQGVLDVLNATIVPILQGIANFISTHAHAIQTVLSTAWNVIKTVVETVLGVISGIIKTVMAIIHGDWEGAWNSIKGVVETIWNGIKGLWNGLWNGIKATWNNFKQAFQAGWDNFWGGLKAAVVKVIREIEKIWNDFKNGLNAGLSGIPLPPSGSGSGSSDNGRALGGPVDEGWWYLHDNEYVLSAAMRAGRQAIPREAIEAGQTRGSAPTGATGATGAGSSGVDLSELVALLRTMPRDMARAVRDGLIQAQA